MISPISSYPDPIGRAPLLALKDIEKTNNPLHIVPNNPFVFIQIMHKSSEALLFNQSCEICQDFENKLTDNQHNYVLDSEGQQITVPDKWAVSVIRPDGGIIALDQNGKEHLLDVKVGAQFIPSSKTILEQREYGYFLVSNPDQNNNNIISTNANLLPGYQRYSGVSQEEIKSIEAENAKIQIWNQAITAERMALLNMVYKQ